MIQSKSYIYVLRDAVDRVINLLHAGGQIVHIEIDRDAAPVANHVFVRCQPTDCFLNLVSAFGALKFDGGTFEHGMGSSQLREPWIKDASRRLR